MRPEILNVSVLSENGHPSPAIPELLESLPEVRVLEKETDPRTFLAQPRAIPPDLVIVELNGHAAPPGWLAELTHSLPQATVLVCSEHKEPEFLIQAMRLGVREFVPSPVVRTELATALERVKASRKERPVAAPEGALQGRIVAVTGIKGGLGATAIAVNLAVALAEIAPNRVALVDLGRPFPDVSKFLDQERNHSFLDLAQNQSHLDTAFVLKTLQPYQDAKLAVLHGCPEFRHAEVLDIGLLEKLWTILRTSFEWIVVDLSHWVDPLYLSVLQEADQVLLLTELAIPDLQNLKKLWALLQSQGLRKDKVGIVVNRYHKGNGLALKDVEAIQQHAVFSTLPSDYAALSEAINYGAPLAKVAPRSKLCRCLETMASELTACVKSATAEGESAQPKARRRFLFF
jgi:pilus assembly protein CpaE